MYLSFISTIYFVPTPSETTFNIFLSSEWYYFTMLALVKSLFVADSAMLEEEKLRKYLMYSYSMRKREVHIR